MNKIKKSNIFKGCLFSNMTKAMLFISNTRSYVPIRLCKIAGSIHLFRIRGRLTIEHVRFKKRLDLGCSTNRLERYQHDFEQKQNKFTQLSCYTFHR